jgi:FMN-dependent NADH-azoreductase
MDNIIIARETFNYTETGSAGLLIVLGDYWSFKQVV